MDCNKDDAFKAKEVAEKKLAEMDIAGASKFALKAHKLYPSLDGLPQFLATLNVYLSAEKRIDGCIDWYKVLGVDPLADVEIIRKHYRKLALILHPDKNKSKGAEGAFKIVSEAWSLLSDKTKRAVFDQKRNLAGMYMKSTDISSSVPIVRNGFHNHSINNNLNRWHQRSNNGHISTPAPNPVKHTFWTVCNSCKVHFEYLRTYLNHNLICPNCRLSFLAVEIPPPVPHFNVNSSSSPGILKTQRQQQTSSGYNQIKKPCIAEQTEISAKDLKSTGFGGKESLHKSFQSGASFKLGTAESMQASASSAAKISTLFKSASTNVKIGHREGLSASVKEGSPLKESHESEEMKAGSSAVSTNGGASSLHKEDRPKKKRCITRHKVQGSLRDFLKQMEEDKAESVEENSASRKSFEGRKTHVSGKFRSISTRELSSLEMRKILMEKARKEICSKLNEWKTVTPSTNFQSMDSNKHLVEDKEGKTVGLNGMIAKEYLNPPSSSENPDPKGSNPFSMSVPDPDFHDFDKDRTEKSFGSNQVWAVYDDDDGMPRYYAMVHKVVLKPFKMQISWLNSKNNNELAPLNWIGCGFPKTSGDFWIGKHESNSFLNSFSHKVKHIRGKRGVIRIFPSKGDVWALYRNWSPDWNEHTPDDVIHKYDMVEVLEDYNEDLGITIAPLVKVVGFKTVFQKHSDSSKIRTIPREEMFRFSHQVPSHLLTGLEGHNAPAGCWEIDPAATPLELLHVAKETEKELEEMIEITEKAKDTCSIEGTTTEDMVEDVLKVEDQTINHQSNPAVEKMLVYSRKRLRGKLPLSTESSVP